MKRGAKVVMLCTLAKGGMRSVVEQYRRDGLFDRWCVTLIGTHDVGSLWRRIGLSLAAEFHLIYLLIFKDVSVVHIHAAMRGSFWRKGIYSITAMAFRKPVIFHLHGSETRQFMGGLSPLFAFLARKLLGLQTRVVVLSEEWRRFIVSVNPAVKIEVLPNYVNLPTNAVRPKSGGVVTGLFLGQIGVRKGVYDLLPALKEVVSTGVNVRLRLGGDGEVDKAKLLASDLGVLDKVDFLGWVSGEDKVRELEEADFYILPSHNEGLPVSVLEAMSFSKPVISTKVGGIPELIESNENGILIDAGDVGAMAMAIKSLAKDSELRKKLGESARTTIEQKYSCGVVLPRLEALYLSLSK